MSDPKFPGDPRLPSIPKLSEDRGRELEIGDTAPPAEEDPIALMIELKAALTNTGELMVRLTTRLARVQLAMLANEHKANTAIERSDAALEGLGKVRAKLGMAAE